MKETYATGAKWESIVGYSRAVKVGELIEVSGSVSIKDGEVYGVGDPYLQAKRILEIIGEALDHFGASHQHVIRTRTYVTNVADWEAVGRAHGEIYSEIKPATSLVEVSRLIHDDYLVEIEATAVLRDIQTNIAGSKVL